jgi:ribosome-associated translation inhibitor RaiA
MVKITFNNLEKSELAREAVEEKLQEVIERFPDLAQAQVYINLAMDNSPRQKGPDLFRVKARIQRGKYDGVILEKEAPSLYTALADLSAHLLARLNRNGDKARVKARNQARRLVSRLG